MSLQFNILLGRNNSRSKSKPGFLLGWQNYSAVFLTDSFKVLQRCLPCSKRAACALAEGRACSRFYCHKVIVHFWSAFCHCNYNYQGFNQTNKRTFNSVLGMLVALPKCDNLDGAAVTTTPQFTPLQSHSGWPRVAYFAELILNIDFAKPEWDDFYTCMSWLELDLLSFSYQQGFRSFSIIPQFHWSEWRGDA